eukprot:TRINITY_DN66844_c7_g1_i4.p1 TRINITY_DN66844_c7_g1~~TRINITY_DN66844_c7_g1_i4.p1  ORF type:complete len:113 (-),score=15.83 TRINITY_DN66844_c7_g1_i4:5-343(-)
MNMSSSCGNTTYKLKNKKTGEVTGYRSEHMVYSAAEVQQRRLYRSQTTKVAVHTIRWLKLSKQGCACKQMSHCLLTENLDEDWQLAPYLLATKQPLRLPRPASRKHLLEGRN